MYSNRLKINFLNVNCWSANNNELHGELVNFNNPDIIGVCETHLQNDETLSLDGYVYMGINRAVPLTNYPGSGGVGLFISKELKEMYHIEKCFSYYDNVIGIRGVHVKTGESFVLYNTYLPPDGSKYARNKELVFSNLLIDIYG